MRQAALAALLLCASAALAQGGGRRWALVIGENEGLSGEEPLRFAEDDARRVLEVLEEVGGVEHSHAVAVLGADAAAVRAALAALGKRLGDEARPGDRLVVYASAHGGDGSLHLDGTLLPLSELVGFVQKAPVGVGLLVVDSCRSGALTRLKGLKPVEGPPVRVEATGLEGRVLITASGADEYAQESDALGGSYFTHHFVTGLRGAADASRDGRVTLEEAYAWAFSRTLESTFGSRGGMQRPGFKIELRGQGELVLSEPGSARGRLTLGVTAPGRWLVVQARTGAVLAEVEKGEGPATLALPPGSYRVRLRAESGWLEREVSVPVGGAAVLQGPDLEQASLIQVALKGGPDPRLVLSAGGAMSSGLVAGLGPQAGAEVRLRRDARVWGPVSQVSLAVAVRDGRGLSFPFRHSELELRAGAGHRFAQERSSVALGLEVGALMAWQSDLPDGSRRTGLAPTALGLAELRLKLKGPVEAYLDASAGAALVKKLSGTFVIPRASASLGLAVSL
ncbi:MAG: caspase family protein [Myxococcaceae bacterium]